MDTQLLEVFRTVAHLGSGFREHLPAAAARSSDSGDCGVG
jgi:hypothetical protein